MRLESKPKGGAVVPRKALETVPMVEGNEKLIRKAVIDGKVMAWVGFGWVPERDATSRDRIRYPIAQEALK